MAQGGLMMAPDGPKMAQGGSKMAPDGPNLAQGAQKGFEMAQVAARPPACVARTVAHRPRLGDAIPEFVWWCLLIKPNYLIK